ncbi:MAG: hypothetical protein IKC32_05800 [Clostridia bacterium]|nr:hypothetical protein [Clostridia bacterium]
MRKSIFTYYKERLIEIGGSNRCLYLKSIVRKNAYDIGRIFEGRDDKSTEFVDFLFGRSKRYVLTLITKEEGEELATSIEAGSTRVSPLLEAPEEQGKKKRKSRSEQVHQILENEVSHVKDLCREIDEIERETGRREFYIGYPFVFGCITQGPNKTMIKAPLLLFPVKADVIDDYTVEISLNKQEQVHINHALIYAYAQSKKLNIDALELEYDEIQESFGSVHDIVEYLDKNGIKITGALTKNILNYSKFKEPEAKNELSLRTAAVLARFPLANSIYADYTTLEKKKLSNDALAELLKIGKPSKKTRREIREERRRRKKQPNSYVIKMLDYAQSEVVRKVEENGNMVIYGPPGTGKSQTIVNIIADAMAKNKRVLVVSQKKAALDVVYNRLGILSEKAIYISDESKEKRSFYERCLAAHTKNIEHGTSDFERFDAQYNELEARIRAEIANLDKIYATLTQPRKPFGLSLSEMYTSSYNIQKNSGEYTIYTSLIEHPEIMKLNYKELSDAVFGINDMKLEDTYYDFMQAKEKNPLIDYTIPGLDLLTLSEVKGQLENISKSRRGLFNIAKYPYYRQVLAFYSKLRDKKNFDAAVKLATMLEKPGLFKRGKTEKFIRAQFVETLEAIDNFASDYNCLHKALTEDGYIAVIDNILRGNTGYIKLVYDALDNYISQRDVASLLGTLDDAKLSILNFAYTTSRNRSNYHDIISKLIEIRIYHEVLRYETECQAELARLTEFEDITSKIYKFKESQLELAYKICSIKNSGDYERVYDSSPNKQDFLYQISKKQKFWPIRKTLEVYREFVLALFPCWLLSPENVSSLLPLEKNMFDIVIFDEASQVFIENTIPTIYRGKTIVVAGDDKQLRPSSTFMKRYLGADPDSEDDYSVQAALEVDSLLDLAVSRYQSANLTYHYRSRSQELIDFSNAAFYSSGLQIAPNTSKDAEHRPITRFKVDGKWINRKNLVEADKVTELLADIFKTRKDNESIGIITFNAEQQSAIADAIDKRGAEDPEFRSAILLETHRMENGEDTGLFIKNLENVQGDERDIIIFSIGYAKNQEGKVYTSFGSLSAEGGQNRLNVAITRAKKKIYVVTSIEPEDLRVDTAKNVGPKLLQKYLKYVRAVSDGKTDEVDAILKELSVKEVSHDRVRLEKLDIANEIKDRLEKQGYTVDTSLGSFNNRISLAVYDKELDKYLVGIELDADAFASSSSSMERDVYKPHFLEARGWTLIRIWCRDWWLSPARVVRTIIGAAEKNKKLLLGN